MFAAQRQGDAYAVVCEDTGRPMTFLPRSQKSAQGTAQTLNAALRAGRRELSRALGAVEREESGRGVRF